MEYETHLIDDASVCLRSLGTACVYPLRMDLLNQGHKEFQQSLGDFTVDILSANGWAPTLGSPPPIEAISSVDNAMTEQ